jgi:hypothetical protein
MSVSQAAILTFKAVSNPTAQNDYFIILKYSHPTHKRLRVPKEPHNKPTLKIAFAKFCVHYCLYLALLVLDKSRSHENPIQHSTTLPIHFSAALFVPYKQYSGGEQFIRLWQFPEFGLVELVLGQHN